MNTGYLFLLITILAETAAVIFMKLSAGFQNKSYAITAVIAYALSFIFLTLALKYLPAGLANAIWAGTSTLLVAVLGIFIFNEKFGMIQSVSLALIIVGLIGLNFTKY
jgi:multidrug transporter EmrE-like cation transporter